MSEQECPKHLNYRGDLTRHIEAASIKDENFIVGPDLFGGFWQAASIEVTHNPTRSRVGFMPIMPPERHQL